MRIVKPEHGFHNDQCEDFHEVAGPLTIRVCTLKNWNGSPKTISVGRILFFNSEMVIFECSDPETYWIVLDNSLPHQGLNEQYIRHIFETCDRVFGFQVRMSGQF